MIPVAQTTFGVPAGNCFTACVASIMELPIAAVPEYQNDYSDEVWWERWVVWLWDHGWRVTSWHHTPERPAPGGYAIMGVRTPSPHCVVTFDGAMVWNPHHNVPLPAGSDTTDWTVITRRGVAGRASTNAV